MILYVLSAGEVREAWAYYFFYSANFWVFKTETWGLATHFWTLAVEEQFYLVWPFVILFVPRRMLAPICVFLLIAAPAFRILVSGWSFALLPGSMDALACGALLAIHKAAEVPKWLIIAAVIGTVATIAIHISGGNQFISSAPLPLFALLVLGASHGFRGLLGHLLSAAPIRYIGRISYGLYGIHVPVYYGLGPHMPKFTAYNSITGAICAVISFGLAAMSWRFLEKPILDRRDKVTAFLAPAEHLTTY